MHSPAMVANAWEKRADVYSSVAALIGVLGARFGYPLLDPIAALVVAFLIGKSAVSNIATGVYGIADRTVDSAFLKKVRLVIVQEENMKNILKLRARKIGQKTWIDAEIEFNPYLKVFETREIINRIKNNVMNKFDSIGGVQIIPRIVGN